MKHRERWATRIGVILAMAGNAVGLGNFLRFPSLVAQNGGGAFMIPYFVALLLVGIPLMWVELAMGRCGGARGVGSSPGVFALLWRRPAARYAGILGVLLPLIVLTYYLYIESWTLAYGAFSLAGRFSGGTAEDLKGFLASFQGAGSRWGVSAAAYGFLLLSAALNYWVISGGIARGIERLALVGMPALFLLAVFLVVRVFAIGAPDPSVPERSVVNGLGFIWNPDFSRLADARVWLAAAGQIFFTLSVGFGAMQCYASYLRRRDDIVVTGLSTCMTNEFVEVILGGSLALPVAFAFFGAQGTREIADGGMFNLGFVTMPAVFQQMAGGPLLGGAWFLLLFLAGLTSSVALSQPAVTFLEDELGWSHRRSVGAVSAFVLVAMHVPVLGLRAGALDELDFWAGTVGLALFAFIESAVFMWAFGPSKAWAEIHEGAEARIPRAFRFVLAYVTPILLAAIFGAWLWQDGWARLTMKGAAAGTKPWLWGARLLIAGTFAAVAALVAMAGRRRAGEAP